MGTTYRFGTVEVRPAERRVLVAGTPAALGARAFDLLVALIENRDRVMTKDELLALVWPGVVVEENNLQVQVSTLRKILGGEAVATLPGRGYRFTLTPDGDGAPGPAAVRRDNLPAELTSFVGRDFETVQLRELLRESRLVTLTGAGGTGKSRLSRHVAAAMLPQFPDGAWLVELASLSDEGHVPLAVATALGIAESDLAAHVAGRQLLILLDNCEHLLRGCAEAARHLLQAGPGVRILATSREALHVTGEATYRMQTLPSPHAIQLFVERARAANPALAPDVDRSAAVAEICKRLDGMPLAIELAAARVRALSVARIAERLDDRFRLLTSGDTTAVPHQQTLRASIDWSYELLSEPERALLRRLSVFAGGCTLEAAEAVCDGGEAQAGPAVMELLANLVEKSLVSLDGGGERYLLLETVREYALEQLEASGEADAVRDGHLEHFLAFASRARLELVGPEQARWYQRVDLERDNILAAQRWCETAGQPLLGLRLVSSLKGYWVNRGMVALARQVTMAALERVPERGRQRARTLYDAGQMAYFMGLFAEARAQLEESVGIAREIGDRVLIGLALQPLGLACAGAGDPAAAKPYLEEALELAREQEEPRRVAAAAIALAQLHRAAGDLASAEPLYEHAVALARELNDPVVVAIGQLNLAMAAVDRLRAPRARGALDEALGIARTTGSRALGQSVLEVCAGLAAALEDWSEAAGFYGAAEAEAARTGIRRDPADDAFLAPHVERARAACREAFDARERWGRALSYDAALDHAGAWLERAPVTG
jgi:predicted ATPase/DNA-binding winged helix-turn-helix (wHTH) protein